MSPLERRTRRDRGWIVVIFTVGLAALGLAAGLGAVVINHAQNQHTINVLTDPNATSQQLESVSDQEITNARNDLVNNANLLTGFTSLGTTPLPNGESSIKVAGGALLELSNDPVRPAVVEYMSNPESRWNRDNGIDRPSDGVRPIDPTTPGFDMAQPDLAQPDLGQFGPVDFAGITPQTGTCSLPTSPGAGGDQPAVYNINVNGNSGTVSFSFATYSVPDRLIVMYEGQTKFDSGCCGTDGAPCATSSVDIPFSGSSSIFTVNIIPNCTGTTGTAWDFNLSCRK